MVRGLGRNQVLGIIFLVVLAYVTYLSQNVSPILVMFFGFVLGYLIAVFVLFVLLGRYGA